jgi:hypothetical protein
MVYGETGIYTLYLTVHTRMVFYWVKVLFSDENRICEMIYLYLYEQHKTEWIVIPVFFVFRTFLFVVECQLFGMTEVQIIYLLVRFIIYLVNNVKTSSHRNDSELNQSLKDLCYGISKTTFSIESYLVNLPRKFRTSVIKWRTTNHHLPVETGRWNSTHRNARLYHLCNCNKIGDECHYLMECD